MRFRLTAAWFWGIFIVASLAGGSWLARAWLDQAFRNRPSLVPVLFVGLVVAWSLLAISLWVELAALHTAWRQRTAQVAGLPALEREVGWRRLLRRFPDPLERLSRPLLRTAWGRRLADEWLDAGLGKQAFALSCPAPSGRNGRWAAGGADRRAGARDGAGAGRSGPSVAMGGAPGRGGAARLRRATASRARRPGERPGGRVVVSTSGRIHRRRDAGSASRRH